MIFGAIVLPFTLIFEVIGTVLTMTIAAVFESLASIIPGSKE